MILRSLNMAVGARLSVGTNCWSAGIFCNWQNRLRGLKRNGPKTDDNQWVCSSCKEVRICRLVGDCLHTHT